jgi:hypothetical protein
MLDCLINTRTTPANILCVCPCAPIPRGPGWKSGSIPMSCTGSRLDPGSPEPMGRVQAFSISLSVHSFPNLSQSLVIWYLVGCQNNHLISPTRFTARCHMGTPRFTKPLNKLKRLDSAYSPPAKWICSNGATAGGLQYVLPGLLYLVIPGLYVKIPYISS